MDIKILKNASELDGSIFGGQILQHTESPSEYEGISRIQYYIYHSEDGTSEEILPNVEKYNIGTIINCSKGRKYLYFASLFFNADGNKIISLIRYNVETKSTENVYSFEDDFMQYPSKKRLRMFVIEDLYIFLQKEFLTSNEKQTYAGFFKYELQFLNLKDNKSYSITDTSLVKHGISHLIQVSDNQCAIKTGFSMLEDNRYNELEEDEASLETVSLVNIGQMISDLIISQERIVHTTLDQAYYKTTIPYLKKIGNYLVYTCVDNEHKQEEIKFYNLTTGETKSCIHQDVIRNTDLAKSYVINGEPYICITKENQISFLNVSTGKIDVVYEIENSSRTLKLERILKDALIFSGVTKKTLLKKSRPFIDIYSFPENEVLLHENSEVARIITNHDDTVFIIEK